MPHSDLGFYNPVEQNVLAQQAILARRHGISAWCFTLDTCRPSGYAEPLKQLVSEASIQMGIVLDVDLRKGKVDPLAIEFIKGVLQDQRYLQISGRPLLVVTLPEDDQLSVETLTTFHSNWVGNSNHPFLIARYEGRRTAAVLAAMHASLEGTLDFPIFPVPGETGSFSPLKKNGAYSVPYSVVVSQAIARMQVGERPLPLLYRAVTLGHDDSPLEPSEPLRYTRFHQREYRRWLDAALADARAAAE